LIAPLLVNQERKRALYQALLVVLNMAARCIGKAGESGRSQNLGLDGILQTLTHDGGELKALEVGVEVDSAFCKSSGMLFEKGEVDTYL
jgi:hypothetical protein